MNYIFDRQALVDAVHANDIKAASMILTRGCDPNCYEDQACVTPLHFAVQHRNVDLVNLLLQHGADPLALENLYLQSPLEVAYEIGHMEIVDLLLVHLNNNKNGQ